MFKNFFKSFSYASRGFLTVIKEERSFRVQVFIAAVVLILMSALPLKIWEIIVLLLSIVMVLVLELLNSVVERLVDALKPRIHPYVGSVKDMMAAAVLVSSIGAAFIGAIVLLPYLIGVAEQIIANL